MTQTLPVGWNGVPRVFDPHVIPWSEGREHSEVGGEEHGGKEREPRAPAV